MKEQNYISNCCGVSMSEEDSLCPYCLEGCEAVPEEE